MIKAIKSTLAKVSSKTRERSPLATFMRRWHRRIGMVSALFVLLLSITGVALNHDAALHLDGRMLGGPLLRALYPAKLQTPPTASLADHHAAVWLDGSVYLDGRNTGAHLQALRGAVSADNGIAIAGPKQLWLFTPDGTLVDRLEAASLPGPVERLGRTARGRLALGSQGQIWLANADITAWHQSESAAVLWARVSADIPAPVLRPALAAWAGKGVSAHRLLADVHSGRIFGPLGPYVMDTMAGLFAILAISGLWLWLRRRKTGARP